MVPECPTATRPTSQGRPAKTPPLIKIRVSWCKGCGFCVNYCKPGVIAMDDGVPHVIAAEKCTRCLQCEAICPDFAIEVQERPAGAGAGGTEL